MHNIYHTSVFHRFSYSEKYNLDELVPIVSKLNRLGKSHNIEFSLTIDSCRKAPLPLVYQITAVSETPVDLALFRLCEDTEIQSVLSRCT